ncbi:uncharacterized protein F5891DRAFT_1194976 [Suillus fuscotomentosus]|uniref:Uncharacterized protein n=1 Tax=Suillus fuscotomentosus TaxID=1912939 RepID=A0AAD4DVC9_9AGAM|nr:uncharacterized protein F5891DRAFT_1194976 [Suillus fuscotomentosus]KAG1894670.1 hypothetical protein F5891DRAFT_1194976 [Suillus fuscotomentosus]
MESRYQPSSWTFPPAPKGFESAYTWDVHTILKEAGMEDLLSTSTNIEYSTHPALRSLTSHFWNQFGGLDEHLVILNGMEADIESSSMGGVHLHSSVNGLLAHLSSFIHCSSPENNAPDALQQQSTPSLLDPHALLARLGSLSPNLNSAQTKQMNHIPQPLRVHI